MIQKIVAPIANMLDDPARVARIHAWSVLFWLLCTPVTILWFSQSILWVLMISLWANIASHATGWSAARSEVASSNAEDDVEEMHRCMHCGHYPDGKQP
jgi:hypothetical protein